MNIRVLIVDDEPLARKRLRQLLADEPGVEVIGECGDGREALAAIHRQRPDLVFLDVQMPEMDGFAMVDRIAPEDLPVIVFATAYDQYALQAFEVHAVDYLLKPFGEDRFKTALRHALAQTNRDQRGETARKLADLIQVLKANRAPNAPFSVKSGSRITLVRPEEIDWIEADGNYVQLHVGPRSFLLRQTMNEIEGRLPRGQYARIHRSIIVNTDRVKEFESVFQGEYVVVLRDGTRLNSSPAWRRNVEALFTGEP